jgi:1,4-dihydroxy-2-naphthoate polyprenyltransferase
MEKDKSRLKIWIRAFRPFSLSGSIIPVALGGVLAVDRGLFNITLFVLAILAISSFQIGANLLNVSDDFTNKVDTKESFGSCDVVVNNLLTPKQVIRMSFCFFVFGALIGLYLTYEGGLVIFLLGLTGALGGYFYTRKPFTLKYRGLGIPLIFLLYGPLPVLGSSYLQTGQLGMREILLSIPVGLLTTAILHANDIRDIYHDSKAGIKTLSIIMGRNKAKAVYASILTISYLSVIIMVLTNVTPVWSITVLITLPLATRNIKKLYAENCDGMGIKTLDQETAKLQMLFGIVFIASILVPTFN